MSKTPDENGEHATGENETNSIGNNINIVDNKGCGCYFKDDRLIRLNYVADVAHHLNEVDVNTIETQIKQERFIGDKNCVLVEGKGTLSVHFGIVDGLMMYVRNLQLRVTPE